MSSQPYNYQYFHNRLLQPGVTVPVGTSSAIRRDDTSTIMHIKSTTGELRCMDKYISWETLRLEQTILICSIAPQNELLILIKYRSFPMFLLLFSQVTSSRHVQNLNRRAKTAPPISNWPTAVLSLNNHPWSF